MLRAILGVVVGYIAMAVFVFCLFTIAYLAMGADAAFRAGTYEVSMLWIVVSIVLSFIAALIGGFVCAVLSRSKRAVQVLAGIVLVLGILVAIPVLMGNDVRPNVRTGNVPNLQAMQNARTPKWIALLNPVIGAVGVLVGAGLKKTKTL
jgi:uncharacterized membrane protein